MYFMLEGPVLQLLHGQAEDYTYCSKPADWTATDCTRLLNQPAAIPIFEGCGVDIGLCPISAPPSVYSSVQSFVVPTRS